MQKTKKLKKQSVASALCHRQNIYLRRKRQTSTTIEFLVARPRTDRQTDLRSSESNLALERKEKKEEEKTKRKAGDGRYLIPTAERVNEHKGSGEERTQQREALAVSVARGRVMWWRAI